MAAKPWHGRRTPGDYFITVQRRSWPGSGSPDPGEQSESWFTGVTEYRDPGQDRRCGPASCRTSARNRPRLLPPGRVYGSAIAWTLGGIGAKHRRARFGSAKSRQEDELPALAFLQHPMDADEDDDEHDSRF